MMFRENLGDGGTPGRASPEEGQTEMFSDRVRESFEFEDGGLPVVVDLAAETFSEGYRKIVLRRAEFRATVRRFGHLMIRRTGISSAADFGTVRDSLMLARASYQEKATPRSSYGNEVYSSTDLPSAQQIRQHNENSYTLDFPGILVFGCLVAPAEGGATPVADVRKVLRTLPDELVDKGRRLGWILERNYQEGVGLPWQTAFGRTDRFEVDAYCKKALIGVSWDGDALRTRQRRSTIATHPVTKDEVWFNHAAFWSRWSLEPDVREVLEDAYGAALPFETRWGDGSAMTAAEVSAMNAAYDRATVRAPWQPGDVLIVDNMLSTHGRDAYSGDRQILVAMGEPVAISDCAPTVAPAAVD
jgi:alpha-ketoglutarate-dependent taurine dioxygenase